MNTYKRLRQEKYRRLLEKSEQQETLRTQKRQQETEQHQAAVKRVHQYSTDSRLQELLSEAVSGPNTDIRIHDVYRDFWGNEKYVEHNTNNFKGILYEARWDIRRTTGSGGDSYEDNHVEFFIDINGKISSHKGSLFQFQWVHHPERLEDLVIDTFVSPKRTHFFNPKSDR